MKSEIIIITAVLASILIFTSCLRPVGRCSYGSEPAKIGTVKILSIEKPGKGEMCVIIRVRGFINHSFCYSESEYEKCFASKGLKAGSEVKAVVYSGGPCPPLFRLVVCGQ